MKDKVGSALVVGGGIAGMQAALDLAASGIKAYVVETKPGIGGAMAQLDKTFPTNDCAMCTMAPRLVDIGRHRDIQIFTGAEVEEIRGEPGRFGLRLRKRARYVDEEKCTGCGTCVQYCPVRAEVQPTDEVGEIELDLEYRAQVEEIIRRNTNRKGPLMPILQEVNALLNYFPEDVFRYISKETGYSLALIYREATFYHAFSLKPRGKYTMNVCMGTTCYVRGSERILERFREVLEVEVGETTEDRLFTLESVRCLGSCGLAPAATIGDRVYGKLWVRDVEKIVKEFGAQSQS